MRLLTPGMACRQLPGKPILLIDIHTHIDQHDRAELPEILDRAAAAGVKAVVIAGTTVESSRECAGLADADSRVFAGVGVHPTDIDRELTGGDLEELERMASSEQVVVMSEVGLDYLPTSPDHEMQKSNLRAQLDIARRHGLPVVFHVRESAADAVQLLADEKAGELGGAAHYFQGDRNYARQVLDLGFHISLAKPLLRLPELQDVAKMAADGPHSPGNRLVPPAIQEKAAKMDGTEGSAVGSGDGRQAEGARCRRSREHHHGQRAGDVRRARRVS